MIFAAKVQNLAAIRLYTHDKLSEFGAPIEVVEDLVLAIDEAATNIIIHGYGYQEISSYRPRTQDDEDGVIDIELIQQEGVIMVTIKDQAPPFDPTEVPPPDLSLPLEQRPIGGLGVFLIRHSVDEFHHRVLEGGGNQLVLIKRMVTS
jgi:serine/threonine-protein kinase RsbW